MPVGEVSLADARCLADIAYGRSGDKGTSANIGILARSSLHYEWLASWLTADRVYRFFEPIGVTSVERFELPNLCGLNFVVHGILQRGLRNDAQGKALAQALLSMPVDESSPDLLMAMVVRYEYQPHTQSSHGSASRRNRCAVAGITDHRTGAARDSKKGFRIRTLSSSAISTGV